MSGTRSPRTRARLTALMALLIHACGGGTEPPAPESLHYTLILIGGVAPPVVVSQPGEDEIEVLASTMRLDPNLQCVTEVSFRRDGVDATWSELCTWVRNTSDVQFRWGGSTVIRASFSGPEFTLDLSGVSGCPVIGNATCEGDGWTYRLDG